MPDVVLHVSDDEGRPLLVVGDGEDERHDCPSGRRKTYGETDVRAIRVELEPKGAAYLSKKETIFCYQGHGKDPIG